MNKKTNFTKNQYFFNSTDYTKLLKAYNSKLYDFLNWDWKIHWERELFTESENSSVKQIIYKNKQLMNASHYVLINVTAQLKCCFNSNGKK